MDIHEAIAHARQVAEGCAAENQDCAYQHDNLADWLEELVSYHDTGLTPEHAAELAQAERDRRLFDIPCRVGTQVWVISAFFRLFDSPVEGHVKKFVLHDDAIVRIEALISMDLEGRKRTYGFQTDSFGGIIFFSREKAEAAIAKRKEATP